jgi:hypothetical protein
MQLSAIAGMQKCKAICGLSGKKRISVNEGAAAHFLSSDLLNANSPVPE